MSTNQQLKEKVEQLTTEAVGIDAELIAAREVLRNQSRDREAATRIAASLVVLEARRGALEADINQARQELERRAAFVSSKEYKTAQKTITELETYFSDEAQAVSIEIDNLYKRLSKFITKHSEYADLLKRYRLDLTTIEQTSKLRGGDEDYLVECFKMIDCRKRAESIINSLQIARPRKA